MFTRKAGPRKAPRARTDGDRPLMPDHGAPLRLYSPTKPSYKNTKYLIAVEFTDTKPGGYWEDQGHPWFGGL